MHIWRKTIPGRGKRKWKGPVGGMSIKPRRKSKEADSQMIERLVENLLKEKLGSCPGSLGIFLWGNTEPWKCFEQRKGLI